MSVKQDRLTFFGVLIALVVVVIGYLQLGQIYPIAGRAASSSSEESAESIQPGTPDIEGSQEESALPEEEAAP